MEKFTDVYGEKTQDYSTAGQKDAYGYYVNCKRPANDALASDLTEEKRAQVGAVRQEFNKFGGALWDLRYSEEGGGTMWGVVSVSSFAAREDFLESFIKTLAAPGRRSMRARRSVTSSLARIQRWLSSGDRKPFTEASERDEVADKVKYYRESMQATKNALSKLREILRTLPDVAGERLATAMAAEAKSALTDTP